MSSSFLFFIFTVPTENHCVYLIYIVLFFNFDYFGQTGSVLIHWVHDHYCKVISQKMAIFSIASQCWFYNHYLDLYKACVISFSIYFLSLKLPQILCILKFSRYLCAWHFFCTFLFLIFRIVSLILSWFFFLLMQNYFTFVYLFYCFMFWNNVLIFYYFFFTLNFNFNVLYYNMLTNFKLTWNGILYFVLFIFLSCYFDWNNCYMNSSLMRFYLKIQFFILHCNL